MCVHRSEGGKSLSCRHLQGAVCASFADVHLHHMI